MHLACVPDCLFSSGCEQDQVPAAVKDAIDAAVADLKKALESEDAGEIKGKVAALNQSLMKIGESLSKKGDSGGDAGAKPEENTYDADVKDEKK